MMTDYFQRDPIYTAGRLYSEGHGKESNPFPHNTVPHELFDEEMERLAKEKKDSKQ